MLPLSDTPVRGARVPIVNILLIVINLIVFLFIELPLGQDQLQNLIMQYGTVPSQVQHGQNLISLLTSMFLHAGWLHILGNMLFLWIFGDNVEDVLGHIGYLFFYLVGGLAASALQIVASLGSDIPSIGASGAIAAVMGAYIVMFPRSRVRVLILIPPFIAVPRVGAVLFLAVWFLLQFLSGLASLGATTSQTSGVAVWAHVGGFLFGVIIGFLARGRASQFQGEDLG